MSNLRWLAAAALLAACAACAGKQARPAADRSPTAELEKSLAKTSTAAEAGTVKEVRGGRLVLDPYDPTLAETTAQLADSTPVFRHEGQVSTPARDALAPGMDVDVYLGGPEGARRVLAVKILSDAEARELRAAVAERPTLLDRDRSAAEEQYGGVSWQAGELRELRPDALVLEPYQKDASARVLTVEGNFDVYEGNERIGREALQPGDDVRVYFDERKGVPRVLGVEILHGEEVRRVREAQK